MRNVQTGNAEPFLQAAQFVAHVFAQLCVKVGKRFVEQQYPRIYDNRPRKRNALLLSARYLRRNAVFHALYLHQLDNLSCALFQFGLGNFFYF